MENKENLKFVANDLEGNSKSKISSPPSCSRTNTTTVKTTIKPNDDNSKSGKPLNKRRASRNAVQDTDDSSESEISIRPSSSKYMTGVEGQENLANSPDDIKSFKRIPIFIADENHYALQFIYSCLESKHLPLKNNTLLHFDSNADLEISPEITASSAFETMLTDVNDKNWIIPVCYEGYFNLVIWAKPSWGRQIPDMTYILRIGCTNDVIKLQPRPDFSTRPYRYNSTLEVEQAKQFKVQVVNANTERKPDPKLILKEADDINYILDIDLQFFSTGNPDPYEKANCYKQLSDIFGFDSATGPINIKKSEPKPKAILRIFNHLQEKKSLEEYGRGTAKALSNEDYEKIKMLVESIHENYDPQLIEWKNLFDIVCMGYIRFPPHISTDDELQIYYAKFREFLENLPHPPKLIIIARSNKTGCCPRNQVKQIQENVLKILLEVFGDKIHEKPIFHYKGELWDVAKL